MENFFSFKNKSWELCIPKYTYARNSNVRCKTNCFAVR